MPLVIAALLGLAALGVVLVPLYAARRVALESEGLPASSLADRERAAKAALQDVEFDYQLGNLADDDYRALRERYTRRALAALKGRYDQERALDDAIEAEVRALRAAGRDTPAPGSTRQQPATAEQPITSAAHRAAGAPDRSRPGKSSPARRGSTGRGRHGRGRA